MLDNIKENCYSKLEELRISKDMVTLNSLGFIEGKDLDKFISTMKDIIKYAPENCSYLISTSNKLK